MTRPNILVVVGDDIGLEQYTRFARGSNYPTTPTLNAWFDGGVRFTNFYVEQLCSPTRVAFHASLHPSDTGIGDLVRGPLSLSSIGNGLSPRFNALPILMRSAGYATACFGKFHIGQQSTGGTLAPLTMGYDHFSGNLFNIQNPDGYYHWPRVEAGQERYETMFHSERIVREALDWIRGMGTDPWFCYLPFFAAHTPNTSANMPPSGTYDSGRWTTPSDADHAFKAHIEAHDYYLGWLAQRIPAPVWQNTIVCYFSDNGSGNANLAVVTDPLTGTLYPSTHGKDTPYDPGIHTPMLFYSPGGLLAAPGRTVSNLVHVVDLMPTIVELGGGTLPDYTLRGVSLVPYLNNTSSAPVHPMVYSEHFLQNGATSDAEKTENQWAMYDGTYVLMYDQPLNSGATWRFFNLSTDPHQLTNLIASGLGALTAPQRAAYDALLSGREAIVNP